MKLLVLGDSHARTLASAAAALDLPLAGGRIAPGRFLNGPFHLPEGHDVRFLDADADAAYRTGLAAVGATRLAEVKVPVLCLFGMNLHYLARADVWEGFALAPGAGGQFLSAALVRATALAQVSGALAFHRDLAALGLTVLSALPPRRASPAEPRTLPEVFLALEDILREELEAAGTRVIDHRPWSLGADGHLKPEYASPHDAVHGSFAFGCRLLEEILAAARPGA